MGTMAAAVRGHSGSPLAQVLGIEATMDRMAFTLPAIASSLEPDTGAIDRGAIVVLADHAGGSYFRRLSGSYAVATLNLRIDWLSAPRSGEGIRARPRLVAHYEQTATIQIDICGLNDDIPIATARLCLIVGVAPGGIVPKSFDDTALPPPPHRGFANFTELLDMEPQLDGAHLSVSDHLVGNASISALHGGALAAGFEQLATRTIQRHPKSTQRWAPVGLWVEYLRPALSGGNNLSLACSTRRIGRSIGSINVTARGGPTSDVVAFAGVKFAAVDLAA